MHSINGLKIYHIITAVTFILYFFMSLKVTRASTASHIEPRPAEDQAEGGGDQEQCI